MKRWWIVGCLIGVVVISCVGCSDKNKGKQIVLVEDVQVAKDEREVLEVEIEKIIIEGLGEDKFRPLFYKEGEWYGTVGGRMGPTQVNATEKYPVGGFTKDRLYAVNEANQLRETAKTLLFYTYNEDMLSYVKDKDGVRKVFSVDYTRQDRPEVKEELSQVLNQIQSSFSEVYIGEYTTKKDEEVYILRTGIDNSKYYFYNQTKGIFYTNAIQPEAIQFMGYMESWDTFICIDEEQQMYKVVFGEDTYVLEPYLDIAAYEINKDETIDTWYLPVEESSLMLVQWRNIRDDEYFSYHPIQEIESIGIFDLETNQYEQILTVATNKHMYLNSLGSIEILGGNVFILDFFETDEEGYLLPQTRQIQLLEENRFKQLYEEDIRNEGKTLSPHVIAEIREDGREIFLTKDQTVLEGVETSKKTVYKRYTLK